LGSKSSGSGKSVKKVIGFFNNHYHGYAPENWFYLIEKLGILIDTQRKTKDKSRSKQAQLSPFFE
jgi:uncharacterized protein YecE (DUF72 family)